MEYYFIANVSPEKQNKDKLHDKLHDNLHIPKKAFLSFAAHECDHLRVLLCVTAYKYIHAVSLDSWSKYAQIICLDGHGGGI